MTEQKLTQVLPRIREIPRLTLSEEDSEGLQAIASRAFHQNKGECEHEPLAVIEAPIKALAAAENYVADKLSQTELPQFRKMLRAGDLRKALETLSRCPDAFPPLAQLRALYCFGDPSFNGLETEDAGQLKKQFEREDSWRVGWNFLAELSKLMDRLEELARGTRPSKAAERTFVSTLACYWTNELELALGNSRVGGPPGANVETGLFADFVRKAATLIPRQYLRDVVGWDHIIRSVRKEKTPVNLRQVVS